MQQIQQIHQVHQVHQVHLVVRQVRPQVRHIVMNVRLKLQLLAPRLLRPQQIHCAIFAQHYGGRTVIPISCQSTKKEMVTERMLHHTLLLHF